MTNGAQTVDGIFFDFNLPYLDAGGAAVSPQSQAESILKMAQMLVKSGAPGVAITYSANTLQTVAIEACYKDGRWDTQTNGSNQASVMAAMEALENTPAYEALQGKVRIAPISTIDYNSPPLKPAQFGKMLAADLARIKTNYLDRGWVVLGWQNQTTAGNKEHPYAVGGGVAKGAPNSITQAQSGKIQATLIQYALDFAPKPRG